MGIRAWLVRHWTAGTGTMSAAAECRAEEAVLTRALLDTRDELRQAISSLSTPQRLAIESELQFALDRGEDRWMSIVFPAGGESNTMRIVCATGIFTTEIALQIVREVSYMGEEFEEEF